jgi:uncharacterized membrane protein
MIIENTTENYDILKTYHGLVREFYKDLRFLIFHSPFLQFLIIALTIFWFALFIFKSSLIIFLLRCCCLVGDKKPYFLVKHKSNKHGDTRIVLNRLSNDECSISCSYDGVFKTTYKLKQ